MPTNKDQKRLIRARMKKTGEAYTSARAVVVARGKNDDGSYAAPRKEWPSLAGQSDEVIRKNTGRTWVEWVAALDKVGAHRMSHRDIARHIGATHAGVGMWWVQSVTVGYERIRGLRDVGQRRDGSYEANKSRTFPVDVSTLFPMFADTRRRKKWLGDGVKKVRTAIANKSIRVDWHDGTQVIWYFTPKGPAKSTVSVQHAKLTGKADVDKLKAFWDERLDALGEALRQAGSTDR